MRATWCEREDGYAVLVVNGDEREGAQLTLEAPAGAKVTADIMCAAPEDKNSFEEPRKVIPRPTEVVRRGEKITVEMPPFSMLMLLCK